jgi:cell division protein FtsL
MRSPRGCAVHGEAMKRSGMIAAAIAAVAGAAMLHVWVHLQVIAVGYDLSRETKARHDLSEMNQRLALELRTRMDLSVVEKVAREQLHMAPPDPRTIRVLP